MHSVLAIAQIIWAFLPICASGEQDVTLTTAIIWNNPASVKPTTLYRRIAVDRHAGERSKGSPDIFHKMNTVDRRRRSHGDIWNWDYWCQFQPQKGNCTTNVQRYYYNSQLDQCETFSYSGCLGNKNNFNTIVDCERYCKGAGLMPLKHIDRSVSCSLQPNAGLCVALFDKFYYDVNEESCKVFVYGGCGGNQNRFASLHQCALKCGSKGAIEYK